MPTIETDLKDIKNYILCLNAINREGTIYYKFNPTAINELILTYWNKKERNRSNYIGTIEECKTKLLEDLVKSLNLSI